MVELVESTVVRTGWRQLRPGRYHFCYRHPDTLERSEGNAKQKAASASDADWLFYGGAAGGGKTAWLAWLAVYYALSFARSQVALFRRTLPELEMSVVLELLRMVPPGLATFNRNLMRFEFGNGSLIWLCYCATENDVYKYQSAQWGMIGIDEASHFTETQVRYLITRLRAARAAHPKWLRLASNPGGVGHGWLKRWFVRPRPEELGLRLPPAPGEKWRPLPPKDWKLTPLEVPTRQFISAKFEDNYILQETQPNYLANLWQLGGDKARQLAEGDWDANDGMIVGGVWKEWHVVSPADTELIAQGLAPGLKIPWHVFPRSDWKPTKPATIFGSVDYGYGAPWSFHLTAVLPDGRTRTFFEYYKTRVRDVNQATMIRDVLDAHGWTPEYIVMDPSMWNSRAETGSKSIYEVYQDVMPNVAFRRGAAGRPARVSRPNRWLAALSTGHDGFPFWSCTTANPELIRTVPEVPWDKDDKEVEDDKSENHAYEDMGRFFESRPHQPLPLEPEQLAGLDPISAAHAKWKQSLLAPSTKPGSLANGLSS